MKYLYKKIIIVLYVFFSINLYAQDIIQSKYECPMPIYPSAAQRSKFQGKTIIEFDVSEDGATSNFKIISSSNYKILDDESIKTIKKCKFTPKIIDGIAVKQILSKTYNWVLDGVELPKEIIYESSDKINQFLDKLEINKFSLEKFDIDNNIAPTCRMGNQLIIKSSFQNILIDAFNKELKLNNKFDGANIISVRVNELKYSTVVNGFWMVDIDLINPSKIMINKKIKSIFPVELNGDISCLNAANVLPSFLQNIIFEFINSDNFVGFVNSSKK